ncbi:MAG TPA: GvpL/GvpF family gas vesicle protein [Candidatus Binatia bacterium]|jgi:hypothetical protein|nr:GvpL/GvpF family gas vesicle protein [Candidatus Binatia bacterium]
MTRGTPEAPRLGKFFYAVILPEGKPLPALVGLDDKGIHSISYQDIAAVVSDYPVTTIKALRKNLFPYHQVTRTLAESCTTIPARFGQIAQHGEEVFTILRRHYSRLRPELERLHHKLEMGVQVFWQVDNLFEYLIQQDRGLKGLRDRLLQKSSSVTRQEQIEFGGRLRDKLQEARVRVSQRTMAPLQEVAVEAKVDEPTEEKMAMNGLFLVWKEQQQQFIAQVEKAAGFMGKEYALKVDGPWVPFNFIEHIELGL